MTRYYGIFNEGSHDNGIAPEVRLGYQGEPTHAFDIPGHMQWDVRPVPQVVPSSVIDTERPLFYAEPVGFKEIGHVATAAINVDIEGAA